MWASQDSKLITKDIGVLLFGPHKEGNALFNNVLHTFYLRLYDIGQTT